MTLLIIAGILLGIIGVRHLVLTMRSPEESTEMFRLYPMMSGKKK